MPLIQAAGRNADRVAICKNVRVCVCWRQSRSSLGLPRSLSVAGTCQRERVHHGCVGYIQHSGAGRREVGRGQTRDLRSRGADLLGRHGGLWRGWWWRWRRRRRRCCLGLAIEQVASSYDDNSGGGEQRRAVARSSDGGGRLVEAAKLFWNSADVRNGELANCSVGKRMRND